MEKEAYTEHVIQTQQCQLKSMWFPWNPNNTLPLRVNRTYMAAYTLYELTLLGKILKTRFLKIRLRVIFNNIYLTIFNSI